MMLKYVKKFENKRPVLLPTHQNSPIAEVRFQNKAGEFDFTIETHSPVFRFNTYIVCLAYTDSEMELTRTCCFEFDRKKRPGGKVSFLCHICVYFGLAGFTHLSPHPQVDKPC